MIEEVRGEVASGQGAVPGPLYLIVDLYKHAWDLYFKALAFYLLACSVIAGFAVAADANAFQRLFAGGAVFVGSLIGAYGFHLGTKFFRSITEKIDRLCAQYGYETITFGPMIRFTQATQIVAVVFAVTGFLYIGHVLITEQLLATP